VKSLVKQKGVKGVEHGVRTTSLLTIRISRHDRWHAKVLRLNRVVGDVELVVPSIVQVVPLQLFVRCNQPACVGVGISDRDIGPSRTRRSNRRTGKLHAYGTAAGGWVIRFLVEPNEIAHPALIQNVSFVMQSLDQ
jgi:hypothetical protein